MATPQITELEFTFFLARTFSHQNFWLVVASVVASVVDSVVARVVVVVVVVAGLRFRKLVYTGSLTIELTPLTR